MDWFLVTFGGAALYSASRWLQIRLRSRKAKALNGQRRGVPLKAVVAQCEAKWFLQELQEAMSGDHAAMVRVSHMLLVGYGTRQDEAAAASWMRKAWALQNFKEPADPYLQYEMLDFKNSDIPQLNDPQQQQQQQQQQLGEQAAAASRTCKLGAAAAAHPAAQLQIHLLQAQHRSSAATAKQDLAPADHHIPHSSTHALAVHSGYNSTSSSSSSNGSSSVQGATRAAAGGDCSAARNTPVRSSRQAGTQQADTSKVLQQNGSLLQQHSQQQQQHRQQQQHQQEPAAAVQVVCQQPNAAASAMHDALHRLVQQHSTAAVAAAAASGARVQLQHQSVYNNNNQLLQCEGQVLSCKVSNLSTAAAAQHQGATREQSAEVHPDHIMQTL